jgi:hypothetical protein
MHRAAEPDEDPTHWADPAAVAPFFLALTTAPSALLNGRRLEAQQVGSLEALLTST